MSSTLQRRNSPESSLLEVLSGKRTSSRKSGILQNGLPLLRGREDRDGLDKGLPVKAYRRGG